MGWEIHFNYYEKNPEGRGYQTESPKSFKKQIGKMEEVPTDRVVAEIVKQMARRDVLVEVEGIFEYTKKPVSFKELKGSIVIKGQKFNLDGMTAESFSEPVNTVVVPQGETQVYHETQPRTLRERIGQTEVVENNVVVSNASNLKIIRMEVFEPHEADAPDILQRLASKGLYFTVNKKYPIFKEVPKEVTVKSEEGGVGSNVVLMYKVSDDNGKMCDLPSTYFHVPLPGLTFMSPQQNQPRPSAAPPRLMYMGSGQVNVTNDNGAAIPQLRRGVG